MASPDRSPTVGDLKNSLGLAQSYAEGSKEFIGEYLERFHGPGAAGAAKALKGIANKLGTHDVVSGFKITPDDIIILDHATFADVNAVLATARQCGADVVIALDNDNAITLRNVMLSSLTADDFRFAA